jgi:hypothetical protein
MSLQACGVSSAKNVQRINSNAIMLVLRVRRSGPFQQKQTGKLR